MEPEVRERFERIEVILSEMAERGRQADLRMDRHEDHMAKQDERMAKQDERMTKQDERMTKHDARMAKHDFRMVRLDERMEKHDARMAKFDERMARYDQKIDATEKLVRAGINFVTKKQSETFAKLAEMAESVNKLARSQQAFVDSLKKGGNGNGRKNTKI